VSESRELLDQFLAQAWDAVDALCRAVAADGPLRTLQPDTSFTAAPFKDRVLGQIDSLALGDPVSAASFALLRGLVPAAVSRGDPVRLHGWDPGGGLPRAIALIIEPPGEVACTVALVFPTSTAGTPMLRVVADAAGPAGGIFPAGPSLNVSLQVNLTGTLDCELDRGGSRRTAGSADGTITVHVFRPGGAEVTVGPSTGPSLRMHGLTADVEIGLAPGSAAPTVTFKLGASDVDVDVLPATVSGLVGGSASPRIALDLSANAGGMQFGTGTGGGTRSSAPNIARSGGLQIDRVGLELRSAGRPSAPLQLGVTLAVTGRVPGLPLAISAAETGAAFGFSVGRGGAFGFAPSEILPLAPSGIGAELDLPFAKGSGFLLETPDGGLAGAFDIDLGFVGVRALAVLEPGRDGRPLSLVVLISAEFPPPGVQLGLGFALTGVGGLVGINRRSDLPALQAAVLDGRVGALMAPASASTNPTSALATLSSVFPAAPGHFVIAPLLHLSWGGRLITAEVALIFDLPDPLILTLVGRLTIAIPDPAAPLILIRVTFLGGFDPSVPRTHFLGTLEGSHILGHPLQGDAFILLSAGKNPALVVSVGGFHPEYPRPAATPVLRRIAFEMSPQPFPRLRAEMYFALTSNSVQFGAGVYLSASLADCGLEGRFIFDALCVFAPDFMFTARCAARVAVEAFGQTLIAVSLDIRLQGPSPWVIHARGSITVLWEDISLDFDASWGDPPPRIERDLDLEEELRKAFRDPKAWMPDTVGADRSGVRIRRAARGETPALHPLGRLQARQRQVPFDVVIHRYQGLPIPPQRWTIAGAGLSGDDRTPLVVELRDDFARAQYFDLSEGDQLSARGFTSEVSGGVLVPGNPTHGTVIESKDDTFDEKIIPDPAEREELPRARRHATTRAPHRSPLLELVSGSFDMHDESRWWADDGRRAVVVQATQPLAVASVDLLKRQALPESLEGRSVVQASQILAAAVARGMRGVQLVEAWETKP
jgi:hypothetical protein